jgi:hypothetical protein
MLYFVFVDDNLELLFDSFNFLFTNKFAELTGIVELKFPCLSIDNSFEVKIFDIGEVQASKVVERVLFLVGQEVIKLRVLLHYNCSYCPVVDTVKQINIHF